jgi:hypothetical protein
MRATENLRSGEECSFSLLCSRRQLPCRFLKVNGCSARLPLVTLSLGRAPATVWGDCGGQSWMRSSAARMPSRSAQAAD